MQQPETKKEETSPDDDFYLQFNEDNNESVALLLGYSIRFRIKWNYVTPPSDDELTRFVRDDIRNMPLNRAGRTLGPGKKRSCLIALYLGRERVENEFNKNPQAVVNLFYFSDRLQREIIKKGFDCLWSKIRMNVIPMQERSAQETDIVVETPKKDRFPNRYYNPLNDPNEDELSFDQKCYYSCYGPKVSDYVSTEPTQKLSQREKKRMRRRGAML